MEPEIKELKIDGNANKKGRQRKKLLFHTILNQMEFYFSDSNLCKDRFLSQLIQKSPFISLDVFLQFNKISKLTSSVGDIRKAVRTSKLIHLSEDQSSVGRRTPVKVKTNVEECTVYVEQLKSDVTHEWLQDIFKEFGTVVYVSIPKYKHNGGIKGFAFIEFENENEALCALNYFESIDCKLSSNVDPAELCSIATFHEYGKEPITKKSEIKEIYSKKRKFEEVDIEENDKSLNSEFAKFDSDRKIKKKQSKELKKKNVFKELGLRVLAKKEWKKMRNKYLDMQRKKMQEFKRNLNKAKYGQAFHHDKLKNSETSEEIKAKEYNMPKLEFLEGVIVKLKLPESREPKKIKNEIKATSTEIKYVDVPNVGSEYAFIRFNSSEESQEYCKKKQFGLKEILEGDEEKAYWNRILKNREDKFQKVAKKERGRDKLLKKANKLLAKHVVFDE